MQKNWYIIYTKVKCEKKVAALLSKKKIETFCPVNFTKVKSLRRGKFFQEPLFKSYVFVNICEEDMSIIKHIDGVINFLYWMGKPAVIKEDEIETIREFTNDHQSIELEKTQVNINDVVRIVDAPSYSIEGKFLSLKNKSIKVNLPSVGYTMVAKIADESIFGRETTILQNNTFSHS